jgi:hypothetical protein
MSTLFSIFSAFTGSARLCTSVRGNGKLSSQIHQLQHFTNVVVSGAIRLNLILSSEEVKASVIADENVLPLILTEVVDDILHIYSQDAFTTKSQPIVNLAAPAVLQVISSGSSEVTILETNQAEISISASGSGNITATGKANAVKLDVSGSGNIHCVSLEADDLEAKISGAGSIKATAKSRASLKVSGSGTIQVWGSPASVQSKRSGNGSIHVQ